MERIGDHPVVRRLLEEGYPEPDIYCFCDECGGEIYIDDYYYGIDGKTLCESCVKDCRYIAG